jgi:hypothetical protein
MGEKMARMRERTRNQRGSEKKLIRDFLFTEEGNGKVTISEGNVIKRRGNKNCIKAF